MAEGDEAKGFFYPKLIVIAFSLMQRVHLIQDDVAFTVCNETFCTLHGPCVIDGIFIRNVNYF